MALFDNFKSVDMDGVKANNSIIFPLIKSDKKPIELFVQDTHKNEKEISAFIKDVKAAGNDPSRKLNYVASLDKSLNVSITVDSKKWHKIGRLDPVKENKTLANIDSYTVLVLMSNPGVDHSYNKTGYNFYAKLYQ